METKKKRPTIASLMETISKLKIENQRTLFTLKKENEKLTADVLIANHKIIESQNTIVSLQEKNKELIAQIEQLTSQVNSDGKPTKNTTDYAVESIIADKIVNKKKYYLVHWKGYGETDDSWEPKKNLNCPYLLDQYEQSKSKHNKK